MAGVSIYLKSVCGSGESPWRGSIVCRWGGGQECREKGVHCILDASWVCDQVVGGGVGHFLKRFWGIWVIEDLSVYLFPAVVVFLSHLCDVPFGGTSSFLSSKFCDLLPPFPQVHEVE